VKIRDRIAQIDRLQNARMFKIIASCIVIVLAIAAVVGYVVVQNAQPDLPDVLNHRQDLAEGVDRRPPIDDPSLTEEERANRISARAEQDAFDATVKIVQEIRKAQHDATGVGFGAAILLALALAVIWLGLGLTYLGLGIVVGLVVFPLWKLGYPDQARLTAGVLGLTGAFLILMQAAKGLLAGANPIFAIARNMLIESVRMKVSLIFIAALILGMAALPGVLEDSSPLRYRVQSFLQYGTGGGFWIIAILTLLFACASMAYEQREKVIWQTMTKPVAPWQYILGKWLGLVVLSGILLAVCSSSVFLFTEYLRGKTAIGESAPFVPSDDRIIAEDRKILESQVLASRVQIYPEPPEFDRERFRQNVQALIEQELIRDPNLRKDPNWENKVELDLYKSSLERYRSVAPGESQTYVFRGLAEAKTNGLPIIFRYQIDSGSNRPDIIYKVGFAVGGAPTVEEVALGVIQSMDLLPAAVGDDGMVVIDLINGDPYAGVPNPVSISFSAKGLELSFSAGSYRWNYLRVMCVLWIKLGFLAMVAVWAGTFLSFPVACLVSFGTFFAAEGATYLSKSLEYFSTTDETGNISYIATVIHAISSVVANMFKIYSDMQPTQKLVEGLRLAWSDVAIGSSVLIAATVVLYGLAVFTLRRRELAVYSGQ
jgi:ABC-type transport system involved in multi-copper enzyme maturation permease subunit